MQKGTIIFVPGISGSELFTPPSFFGWGDRIKVWLNYAVLVSGGWRWLTLADDGLSATTPLTGPLQPGGPIPAYYNQTFEILMNLGWRVRAPLMDWRTDIRLDAARLAFLLQQEASRGPLMILCHSRGGLVTRLALQVLASTGSHGMVGRVAGLGVPHYGSWQAAALLTGWNTSARTFRALVFGLESALFPGPWNRDILSAIVTWPSVYQLLPAPTAPGLDPALLASIYTPAYWEGSPAPINVKWLALALQTWNNLNGVPKTIPWLDVSGYPFDTAYTPLTGQAPLVPGSLANDSTGDGTVPAPWSVRAGHGSLLTPTAHHALAYDGRVLRAVSNWFATGAVPTSPIVGAVLP